MAVITGNQSLASGPLRSPGVPGLQSNPSLAEFATLGGPSLASGPLWSPGAPGLQSDPSLAGVPSPQANAAGIAFADAAMEAYSSAASGRPLAEDSMGAALPHWSVTPQSAADQALVAIDQILSEQDDTISGPVQSLSDATFAVQEPIDGTLKKVRQKVQQAADRQTTMALDTLDSAITNILQATDTWQFDLHFMLTQLAAKAGLTQPGEQLASAVTVSAEAVPGPTYGSTLVLSIREALPVFADLIEVLREIRDRMPPLALRVAGEPKATYPGRTEPDVDNTDQEPDEQVYLYRGKEFGDD